MSSLVMGLRRQERVSGTHRQSRILSHRLARDNLCRKEELLRHLAEDRQLLIVLLSEVGVIRSDQIQQFQYDRHHSLQETRPVRSFQHQIAPVRLYAEAVAV